MNKQVTARKIIEENRIRNASHAMWIMSVCLCATVLVTLSSLPV